KKPKRRFGRRTDNPAGRGLQAILAAESGIRSAHRQAIEAGLPADDLIIMVLDLGDPYARRASATLGWPTPAYRHRTAPARPSVSWCAPAGRPAPPSRRTAGPCGTGGGRRTSASPTRPGAARWRSSTRPGRGSTTWCPGPARRHNPYREESHEQR